MLIPSRILAYAEVVVDPQGVAHRPAHYRWISRYYQRITYRDGAPVTVEEPAYDLGWYPKCQTEPGASVRPVCRQHSAGWAHHLGYEGCPLCWPQDASGPDAGEETEDA